MRRFACRRDVTYGKGGRTLTALVALAACIGAGPGAAAAQGGADDIEMSGFSMILSLGVGYQSDGALPEAETGLAGLNLGLGGFVTDALTVMFRVSGTTADYGPFQQTSGFGGVALGYWVNPHVNLEAGVGAGVWAVDDDSDGGLGLLLGAKYSFYTKGKHSLGIGIEYAPVFVDPEPIHNVGLVFAWQLL